MLKAEWWVYQGYIDYRQDYASPLKIIFSQLRIILGLIDAPKGHSDARERHSLSFKGKLDASNGHPESTNVILGV